MKGMCVIIAQNEHMIKHLPAELLQETCCPSSRVRPSVIVQEDNTGTKHPAPLVLNGPSQFLQLMLMLDAKVFHLQCVLPR
jgi:hypothetical protein